ncbi:hypothetical protein J2W46_003104 [Paraburkholderia strydomiana]|nr:hypothetical protein [Paraburkholderia strydomiana]
MNEWLGSYEPWLSKLPSHHYVRWRLNHLGNAIDAIGNATRSRPRPYQKFTGVAVIRNLNMRFANETTEEQSTV